MRTVAIIGVCVSLIFLCSSIPALSGEVVIQSERALHDLAFSPDGEIFATDLPDSSECTLQIWDRSGRLLRTFEPSAEKDPAKSCWPLYAITFSPDNKHIAFGTHEDGVRIWSRDGRFLRTLRGHTWAIMGLAFSADGKYLVTASRDGTAKIWSIDGKLLKTLTGHTEEVNGVAISPDSTTIATASQDKTIKLWNMDGKLLHTIKGHNDWVHLVAFSSDGNLLATGDREVTKLWTREGKPVATLKDQSLVAFGKDGALLTVNIGEGVEKTASLWTQEGKLFASLKLPGITFLSSISLHPDGKSVAYIEPESDKIHLLTWDRPKYVPVKPGNKPDIELIGFSDDGNAFGYLLSSVKPDSKDTLAEMRVFSLDGNREVLLETASGSDGDAKAVSAKLKENLRARLAELKLGGDTGTEMYKSGTATKTKFSIEGIGQFEVSLNAVPIPNSQDETLELVLTRPGSAPTIIYTRKEGFKNSLNTVRLSKNKKTLAIVMKYSGLTDNRENRLYAVALVPAAK